MGWREECRAKCQRVKYIGEEIAWAEKPNHAGWLKGFSTLLDDRFVTIPGLHFEGVYESLSVGGEVFRYGLFDTHGRDRHRVFQIEVYPRYQISHREKGRQVLGPHIHLGHKPPDAMVRPVLANLDAGQLKRWAYRFKRHAKISDSPRHALVPPFHDGIFSK
ncbi:hypothetical protein [Luteimonas granuli]|uniref:Uncharacterized protein n=1 Tax=Luteimonas granuli TaxID=1176533 RepID=A0A518N1M0_9GAMM|nr:hypothetical protein [Luteimonas granuli]QDW65820.1 hypothetical protein FPZ22_01995 [Luteimonas granuli]